MARKLKQSDLLRDALVCEVFGHELDRRTLTPLRAVIDTRRAGDYGSDPIGNGMVRMVPSGDVVTAEEAARRLKL